MWHWFAIIVLVYDSPIHILLLYLGTGRMLKIQHSGTYMFQAELTIALKWGWYFEIFSLVDFYFSFEKAFILKNRMEFVLNNSYLTLFWE